MKKLLSVILVLSMILGSVSSVGVFALDEDVTISLVTKEAEYVEGTPSTLVAVELSENPGISNLMLVVYYRADELKLSENTDKAFENSIFSSEQSGFSSELSGTSRSIKKYLPEGAVASEYKGFTVDLCGQWNDDKGIYEEVTEIGTLVDLPFEAVTFSDGAEYEFGVVVAEAYDSYDEEYPVDGAAAFGTVKCIADNELGKYDSFTLFLSPEEQRIENRKEDTIKVDLRIDENPGIWNLRCYIVYPEALVLKGVENGYAFPDDTFSVIYSNKPLLSEDQLDSVKSVIASEKLVAIGNVCTVLDFKYSADDQMSDLNGICASLEFEIPKNAKLDALCNINVYCAKSDVYGPPSLGFEGFIPATVGASVILGCDHSEIVTGYKEPTCGADGYDGTVCAFCNELYSGEIIPATGEHIPDGEATCTRGVYCTVCKKLISPPNGVHTLKVGSSCVSDSVCSVCGIVMGTPPGHVRDEDGVCTVCGAFSTSHPYPNEQWNKNTFITHKGAESITITFSKESKLDSYGDYVSVYDKGGVLIGKYTGTQMASKTVTVPGDIVRVCFYSNYGGTDYGFDIESVTWEYPEFFGDFGYIETNLGKEIEIINYKGSDEAIVIPSEINGKPVTSIGSGALASYHFLKNVEIPSSVKKIGDRAFYNCSKLENVIINSSVEKIGSYAFSECDKFVFFVIPEGVTTIGEGAFSYCSGLKMLLIPSTVKTIGDDIVWQSTKMEKILFSGTDDQWRFKECTLVYEDSSEGYTFYPDVYSNCVCSDDRLVYQINDETDTAEAVAYLGNETEVIILSEINGAKVTALGSDLLDCKKDIEKIHIPATVNEIRRNIFYGCSSLKGVYIEDIAAWCNITFGEVILNYGERIWSNPLAYANGLYLNGVLVTDLVIPEGVTTIKPYAFLNCTSIKSITVPETVRSIGKYAFYECVNLETVYYMTTSSLWSNVYLDGANNCFYTANVIYNHGTEMEGFRYSVDNKNDTITVLDYHGNSTDIVIPSSYNGYIVRYMDFYAFEGREDITSVVIPETMWMIPEGAFKDCKNLRKVTISEGVRDIGDYAFSGCTAIAEIIIPESVEYIFTYAFNECTSLQNVSLPYTLMTIEYKAFYMCDAIDRVTYNGSEERWENITVASGNASLERAGIVFAETPDTGDNEVRFSAVGEMSEDGDTVTVKVYVDENPGTWCMRFNVNYNSEYFTFLSAENGRVYLDSETAGRNLGDCYSYYAENTDVYENNSKTGLILTLTFAVAEGIPGGEYSFNVDFPDDVESWFFDVNTLRGRTVSCTSQAQVTVEGEDTVILGDLNGDSEINAKDANLIKQIIAGESPVDGEALTFADLNSDGEVNAKDANLMKQLIAGEIQM